MPNHYSVMKLMHGDNSIQALREYLWNRKSSRWDPSVKIVLSCHADDDVALQTLYQPPSILPHDSICAPVPPQKVSNKLVNRFHMVFVEIVPNHLTCPSSSR